MKDGAACRSELLVAARRGDLGGPARLALDAHLAACDACRMARDVGASFDALDAVEIGDGARIQALASVARRRGQRRRGHWQRVFAVAAALVMLCGSASAALWWRHRNVPAGSVTGSVPAAPAGARRAPSVIAAVPATSAVPVAVESVPSQAAPAPTDDAWARETPAALFRRATEARWRHDRTRAIALYQRLQRRFSSSPEALLGTVPLGRLLLEGASPRAAAVQFDRYLSAAPAGALAAEALYGRARAAALLGDHAQEREAWNQLASRFPDSAYAPLGRARLAEHE